MDCELLVKVWIGKESFLGNQPFHCSEGGFASVIPLDKPFFRSFGQLREGCTYLTASEPEIAVVLYHSQEVTYLRFGGRALHIDDSLNLLWLGFDPFLSNYAAEILYLWLTE